MAFDFGALEGHNLRIAKGAMTRRQALNRLVASRSSRRRAGVYKDWVAVQEFRLRYAFSRNPII